MGDDGVGAREEDILKARRASLDRLRARGVEPFALRFDPDAAAADLHTKYATLESDRVSKDRVTVAGRVVLARRHGNLTFFTLRDRTGDIQLFCAKEFLGDRYELVGEVDLGDIVGAHEVVMTTKRGEL